LTRRRTETQLLPRQPTKGQRMRAGTATSQGMGRRMPTLGQGSTEGKERRRAPLFMDRPTWKLTRDRGGRFSGETAQGQMELGIAVQMLIFRRLLLVQGLLQGLRVGRIMRRRGEGRLKVGERGRGRLGYLSRVWRDRWTMTTSRSTALRAEESRDQGQEGARGIARQYRSRGLLPQPNRPSI